MIFAILNFCSLNSKCITKISFGKIQIRKQITQIFLWILLSRPLTKKQRNYSGFFIHNFHSKYICLSSTIFVWREPKLFMETSLFKKTATEQQGYGPLWFVQKLLVCHLFFESQIIQLLLPYYHLDSELNGACKMVFAKSIVSTLWLELRIICCSRSS